MNDVRIWLGAIDAALERFVLPATPRLSFARASIAEASATTALGGA